MNVITLGTFDLFHVGHVRLLERCRLLSGPGQVTVGLNSDAFVTRYKGRRPVIGYDDRAAVLEACRHVDAVVANDQNPSASAVILASQAEAIVVGNDWEGRDYSGQLGLPKHWFRDAGIRIIYVPYTEGVSSTSIRAAVLARVDL